MNQFKHFDITSKVIKIYFNYTSNNGVYIHFKEIFWNISFRILDDLSYGNKSFWLLKPFTKIIKERAKLSLLKKKFANILNLLDQKFHKISITIIVYLDQFILILKNLNSKEEQKDQNIFFFRDFSRFYNSHIFKF